jgi:hypothetical protein
MAMFYGQCCSLFTWRSWKEMPHPEERIDLGLPLAASEIQASEE